MAARESFFSVSDIFRERRKLTVFLVCVVVSMLSWVLVSLGKNYSLMIIVPVKYVDFPENLTLMNNVPEHLVVNVSGSGYDLLQNADRLEMDTLAIGYENLKISTLGDYQRGYLDPAIFGQKLQNRFSGSLAINRVLSDSIGFLFDQKTSRYVAVRPAVEFTVAQGHTLLDSPTVMPPAVDIHGPHSLIDTLRFMPTLRINAGEVNATKEVTVGLDYGRYGPHAGTFPDSVVVSIRVDKLTEKRLVLKLMADNVPDSLEMLTFPNTVEVVAQVPLSRYDAIVANDFRLWVDYKQLRKGQNVLPVLVSEQPSEVKKISIQPKNVEVVLSRRK